VCRCTGRRSINVARSSGRTVAVLAGSLLRRDYSLLRRDYNERAANVELVLGGVDLRRRDCACKVPNMFSTTELAGPEKAIA